MPTNAICIGKRWEGGEGERGGEKGGRGEERENAKSNNVILQGIHTDSHFHDHKNLHGYYILPQST